MVADYITVNSSPTAPSSGLVLGFNSTAETPQGQRCTSSSCSSTGFDYLIQAQSADFITTMSSPQTYLNSNVNPGDLFKDAIGNYLQTCTFENDFCMRTLYLPGRVAFRGICSLRRLCRKINNSGR